MNDTDRDRWTTTPRAEQGRAVKTGLQKMQMCNHREAAE